MDVAVLFGSSSDSPTYTPIVNELRELGVDVMLKVCSAHRTPHMLHELNLDQYELIVAGAGLAAHLPGVVAAHTLAPVVGIPCDGAFSGLDAFLAIVQMPPGIPVLSVGLHQSNLGARIKNILGKQKVVIVGADRISADAEGSLEKAEKLATDLDIQIGRGSPDPSALNIALVSLDMGNEEIATATQGCQIVVPLKEQTDTNDALTFLHHARNLPVFFTGCNRIDNAIVACAHLLNKREQLRQYREQLKQKVMEANKVIS